MWRNAAGIFFSVTQGERRMAKSRRNPSGATNANTVHVRFEGNELDAIDRRREKIAETLLGNNIVSTISRAELVRAVVRKAILDDSW